MNRYKMFCLLLLSVCGMAVMAQTKSITVTGLLTDADTKEPVEMAAVQLLSLPDSTQAAGVTSQKNGKFTLQKVRPGNYLLKVSFLGYQTVIKPLRLTQNKTWVNVGSIALESDAVLLSEAVIVAEAPPVTIKADTTEYSAAAYRVAEGAMLEELVKKIPGAEVDDEGNITFNGKEIKKILVDGKEFFSDDPKVAMKNLPAEMIEKVKAYDKQSDMARITGIDDGEEEAVLDLSVKPEMKKGWLGNVIAGYGSENRYEAGAMISTFKDNSSISIIASANNTNSQGFSEFGDAGEGLETGRKGAGSGVTTARALGVNFNKESDKLKVRGNVQYGYSNNDARSKESTETFLGESSSFGTTNNMSNRIRHDVRADVFLEWRPDTMTTFIFRPRANYSHTDLVSESDASTENSLRELINRNSSSATSVSQNVSFNGNLMFFRKLNNKGRNIYVGARFGYSDSETDGYSYSDTYFQELDSLSEISRFTDKNSDSRNWSIGASYTEPVFNKHFLQFRYEFSHRRQLAQSLVYDSINVYPDYLNLGYDDRLSTRVENFYDTHTAEMSLRGVYPKLMYSVGVGLTPQSSLSETSIGINADRNLPEQNVLNWAPSVFFRYAFSKQHMLMFRYRGRSSTPNIEDLQEVIDITDPMNMQYGNPNLKPSFRNNFMLFYNKFDPQSMRSYSLNLFYTNVLNSVANRMTYDPLTGARTYRKENVNGNWNVNGYFSFNTPFKNKKFTLSANSTVRFNDAVSYTTVGDISEEQELSTTHNLVLGQNVMANYRCSVFDVSLNGSVNYNWVRNSKQANSNRQTFDYYAGGSTNITLPWQVYLSTDVNCRFKTGYAEGFNNTEIIWNAQVSKSFLKNNAATIRFKIYDILKQQSNLSRTVTETMMSDTEYNTLGSYFMVHFVYRFNTLGGNAGTKRPPRPGFGPGPRPGMRPMH